MPVDHYNPDIARRDLKYYIFDWDDNILRMPTYIHLERKLSDGSWVPHLVSTALFSVIRKDTARYRPPGGEWDRAFVEFRDPATRTESKFLEDARTAIDRLLSGDDKTPPSFNTFRKTLREGRIFAIVTARGHKPESLRKGVEMFIDRILSADEKAEMVWNLRGYLVAYEGAGTNAAMTDGEVVANYLSMNRYHAVTNPDFLSAVRADPSAPGADNPETRKQFAILDFLEWLFRMIERIGARRPISVGFSDDDPGNVAAVADFIRRVLAERFPAVKFVVYDTSDPDVEKGHKLVVSGQMALF